jgi:predicted Zn-dependent protease
MRWFFNWGSTLWRRLPYFLLSLFAAVGVWTISTPVWGFSIWDVLPSAVEVIQLSTMSDEQEVAIGEQLNERLLRSDVDLYRNRQVTQYVNDIGQRLVGVSDRADLRFTFQVVEDDSINAFATLGGFVYINTGLIREADNEAELAGVIAHEIGHITEKHVLDRLRQAAIAQGVLNASGVDADVLVNIAYELVVNRPNSRRAEFEADRVGLDIIRDAGYAPIGMVNFYENLTGGGGIPEFLSTHPNTEDRIQRLRQRIDSSQARQGEGLNASAYRRQIQPLI